MPLIEKRYAEALIKISSSKDSMDDIQKDLIQVYNVVNENNELKKFINNASIKALDKKNVIEKIFSKEIKMDTLNFLKLLVEKGRIKNLEEIVYEYSVLADEIRSCLNIEVTTAAEISKEHLEKIGEKFKKQYKSKAVKINHKIDSSIIGGVIVKVGDRMIDGSVKGKLDGMLNTMQ